MNQINTGDAAHCRRDKLTPARQIRPSPGHQLLWLRRSELFTANARKMHAHLGWNKCSRCARYIPLVGRTSSPAPVVPARPLRTQRKLQKHNSRHIGQPSLPKALHNLPHRRPNRIRSPASAQLPRAPRVRMPRASKIACMVRNGHEAPTSVPSAKFAGLPGRSKLLRHKAAHSTLRHHSPQGHAYLQRSLVPPKLKNLGIAAGLKPFERVPPIPACSCR